MDFKRFAFYVLLSLPCSALCFPQTAQDGAEEILSLTQIDFLIDTTDYNGALRAITKYMAAYPNDFDRAQKRINRIMKEREAYNKGAEDLVNVIRAGEESHTDKLTKITELEKLEQNSTSTVFEFTNLARRTVTLGEVLSQYNRIMVEGSELIRKGKFYAAATKFEEGFSLKNEFSDIVFEMDSESGAEGKIVVYESDITNPTKKAVSNVRSLVAGSRTFGGMTARIDECEKAYNEYLLAVSSGNADSVSASLRKVNSSFEKFAELRNKIMDEGLVLEKTDALANERNPLLLGTSYITFYKKFVLGDESNPDTGIIGAFDAYFNNRVESMKSRTNDVVLALLDSVFKNLPVPKIYSLAENIPAELQNVSQSKAYAQSARTLHALYGLVKNPDGTSVADKHSVYSSSMGFVSEFISDLSLSYSSAEKLAEIKKNHEKISKNDSSETMLASNLEKLNYFEQIKKDSQAYNLLVKDVAEEQKRVFEEKDAREREIAELIAVTGGSLKIQNAQKRNTAGVQISDEMLDFRAAISYFVSLNNQNYDEAAEFAQKLWGYFAQVYAKNASKSYSDYEKLYLDCERLLYGGKKSASSENEFQEASFVKKYPVEAKASAEKLKVEISSKLGEFANQKNLLAAGEEYREKESDYRKGLASLEKSIKDFENLHGRVKDVLNTAIPQIRLYESLVREANEQYDLALSLFKKDDFDAANLAVENSSEKFAAALDIEYSEKIRAMREEKLSKLATDIQQKQFAKVLREVYDLKEKATASYYSSDFDSAENFLVAASAKWAGVSTEPDSEIEELLGIVKTVKSINYGRVLLQSDPHYSELSNSLDMADKNFARGVKLKNEGKVDEAKEAFNLALANVHNVQNVYLLNKDARLLELKIRQELDPASFAKEFEQQYKGAKKKSDKREQLADLEDLYEINPKFPGLADDIYRLKDSLGMFPKKEVKKEVKKSAESKIAEARKAFKAAGDDEAKLNKALALANEAISIDGTSRDAKELKLEIQLKIGATATAILSQNDEKMYAQAARLFNQRRFDDAKKMLDSLLKSSGPAKKSRKVVDLYNRLLKRL
ncbi:hypothetical protein [uncultured Treponema sp.]|uniref:hypothetical protein n=1 Tax=uncultured Treponema sp. TaxID=162155 RepID=UPI0025F942EB|nr:hypothetical protein [uncultured Treponema sp.]